MKNSRKWKVKKSQNEALKMQGRHHKCADCSTLTGMTEELNERNSLTRQEIKILKCGVQVNE